jgi:phosphoribosylaminoimidazole (AIR) synthetase
MILEYTLKYGNALYTVTGGDFEEAVEKLSEQLKIEINENQVRISSVVRIDR